MLQLFNMINQYLLEHFAVVSETIAVNFGAIPGMSTKKACAITRANLAIKSPRGEVKSDVVG